MQDLILRPPIFRILIIPKVELFVKYEEVSGDTFEAILLGFPAILRLFPHFSAFFIQVQKQKRRWRSTNAVFHAHKQHSHAAGAYRLHEQDHPPLTEGPEHSHQGLAWTSIATPPPRSASGEGSVTN